MNIVLILLILIFALICVLILGGFGERKKRREYEKEYERRERETKRILKEKNKKAKKESRKYIDLFDSEEEQNEVIKTGVTTEAKEQNEVNPELINDILNETHDDNQEDFWTEDFGEPSNFVDKPKQLWNEKALWQDPEPKHEPEFEQTNNDTTNEADKLPETQEEQTQQEESQSPENEINNLEGDTFEFNSDLFGDKFNNEDNNNQNQ